MLEVLAISVPFFALIFMGLAAHAWGFCNAEGATLLSRYAFYVALPPFLFLKIAANDPADILNWGFIWRYEAATVAIFLLAAGLARVFFRLSRGEMGIFGLNATYPNYGYIGVPLCILAFGDEAALPLGLIMLVDTIVLLALTSVFVSDGGGGLLRALGRMAATMARNPLLQSVVLGLAFGATGWHMPVIADRLLVMLAGAAAPVALFALGATLYGQPVRSAAGELGAVSLVKLVLHPLLVAALFIMLPGQGEVWVKSAITAACLPTAANAYILAQVYGAYAGRTASSIFLSTVLATATLPVVLYMMFFFL